jgi:hypothetical protein
MASSTTNLVSTLSSGGLIGVLPGQAPVVVQTSSITVAAQRSTPSSMFNANFSTPSVNVSIPAPAVALPSALPVNTSGGAVDSSMANFKNNLYAFSDGSPVDKAVVSFSLSTGGKDIDIKNLSTPILITIPNTAAPGTAPLCRFWNATNNTFSTDGCVVSSFSATQVVWYTILLVGCF